MVHFILSFLFILFSLVGCSQRQESPPQESESSSVELTLPQIPKIPQIPKLPTAYKPTKKDIQIALKNAGFYMGKIDGDIGPMSKQAIREFQAENNLVVDGEVGPKTWAVLKEFLKQPKE